MSSGSGCSLFCPLLSALRYTLSSHIYKRTEAQF